MRFAVILIGSLLALSSVSAFAGGGQPPKDPNCAQVYNECVGAHFVAGQAGKGTGLWCDCIDPIMKGAGQPSNAKQPLPTTVTPAIVAACKTAMPKWGEDQRAKCPK